jgi:hypothetical protein
MLESLAEVGKMEWFDENVATVQVGKVFLNDGKQYNGGKWHGGNPTCPQSF